MSKHFEERYKDKSQKELQSIVDSRDDYQIEAVKAALLLLEKNYGVKIKGIILKRSKKLNLPKHEKEKLQRSAPVYAGLYFLTFSKREPLTILSMSILFIAITTSMEYLLDNDFLYPNHSLIMWIVFIVVCILNHIFYRLEHKRRNLFWGRIIHVAATFYIVALLYLIYDIANYDDWFVDESPVSFLVASLFLIFATEAIISLLRRTLLLIKWQIW